MSASHASLPPLSPSVKGLQIGIQPFRCPVPFRAPSGCREGCTALAGPWELSFPGAAAGDPVGEQRKSQKASHPHVRQLTPSKLQEIPIDAHI